MKSELQTFTADNKIIPRQSNIELLRIIAMIIIVAHHFAIHSNFEFSSDITIINKLWVLFNSGGKIGVNIFVLISGYFLVTSTTFKTNKIIKLWLQIFTYSIVIFFIFIGFGIEPFGIKALIYHLLPVTYSQWWFATWYFVLYLFSPFINRLLNTLTKKIYQRFLVLFTTCLCIIPTFLVVPLKNNLFWFIYLYTLGGWVRLHATKNSIKGSTYIILSFVLIVLTFCLGLFLDILGTKISFFKTYVNFWYLYDMQHLPMLLISFLMFIGFLKINIGYNRIINIISSALFGVYLIHDNSYVRPFLWKTIFKNTWFKSNLFIPYSIMVIALVFIICTAIELFRIYVLEKHYMKSLNKVEKLLNAYIET